MISPSAYPADYAPSTYGPGDEDDLFAGTCDDCDSRIRSRVQRGADHCLQCQEVGR